MIEREVLNIGFVTEMARIPKNLMRAMVMTKMATVLST